MPKSQTIASPLKSRNSPSSRSLLARIAAPFSSNQRSPLEQEIRLDEPFRKYFAGDTIKGAVLLTASKALRITHLVIRLHGFVKVVNNARLPGETIPYDENLLTSSKKKKGIEYFGNGFARLFEDERVLCGDGRLSGRYEFRFELDLPSTGVPSGIDFEHGTISYLLTSTLTRPSTISPTLTVHHKLNVTGTIDIAHLEPPKPRVVSLEAVSQKTKSRLQMRRRSTPLANGKSSQSPSLDGNPSTRMSSPSPHASDVPPQSPVPSTVSSVSTGQSTASACNHLRVIHSQDPDGSNEQLGSGLPVDRTITIKTELLHGGCLPGDTMPIRINIDHMKPVKTMQGLIITVFRQGRIDTHPALPLGSSEKGSKRQYEDYYPKSRTGLGGLSLSSAGSSRVFRQDLAQTITPLIVDPQTLNAYIKTSIQMPDHAFPTITGVPGEMISFKYFVEIVIDLRGKLAGQDRFLPNLSITNAPQYSYGEPKISKVDGIDGVRYSATPGFNYLITDQIRRTKGVIFTTTEVIVGTKDSGRSRVRKWETSDDHEQTATLDAPQIDGDQQVADTLKATMQADVPFYEPQSDSQSPSVITRSAYQADLFRPPSTIDEPQDEKSQIRRAEERLLPSSPPQDGESSAAIVAPTAPFAHDEDDFISRYGFGAVAPAYDEASVPLSNPHPPLLPPQSPHGTVVAPQEQRFRVGDDKQELELQRLQAQRGAPEDDDNRGVQAGRQSSVNNASAFREEDEALAVPPSSLGAVQVGQESQQENDHQPQQARANGLSEALTSSSSSSPSQQQQSASHPMSPSAPTLEEVEPAHMNDAHDDHDHDEIDNTNYNDDDEQHLPGYTQ